MAIVTRGRVRHARSHAAAAPPASPSANSAHSAHKEPSAEGAGGSLHEDASLFLLQVGDARRRVVPRVRRAREACTSHRRVIGAVCCLQGRASSWRVSGGAEGGVAFVIPLREVHASSK